ncbi:LYR motif-containing protein 4 [Malaya genurostris]|uniref:LYR motif-containing protein 4 n=1 Tax=Malaya genurostris TaxID=325434 RepID=UPI0026F3A30F|nr:LYR motif-containing protein 4 [Malaya genurostris]
MKVLALYKQMLREAQKFSSYNYRSYAVRRIQDAFRENKTLKDSMQIQSELEYAQRNLEIIKRQVLVSQLFQVDKLIIEK